MAGKKDIIYAEKVLIYMKDGEVQNRVFNLRGKNKTARETALTMACAEIKRLVCDERHEYLGSFFRGRLN